MNLIVKCKMLLSEESKMSCIVRLLRFFNVDL